MLINKTPFRVSFLGGGTDLPWFYKKYGGAVISTSINMYMYLSIHRLFASEAILLKYSQRELVEVASQLRHPIARKILENFEIKGVEISVSADIPAGTGLGSSSAFTVGLYDLIARYSGLILDKMQLAENACRIEIEELSEPIGKQDQFSSAFGGLNLFRFNPNGTVEVQALKIPPTDLADFDSSLYLVRTKGKPRSASSILNGQKKYIEKSKLGETSMSLLADMAISNIARIENNIFSIADLVNDAWSLKKMSNPDASNKEIDQIIKVGLDNGVLGAKLLGAGGSGFVLFICKSSEIKNVKLQLQDYHIMKINMENRGSHVIYEEENRTNEI
jgi:D-glycero-alpha-D-manno-heptose-7-phosphate kinase